MKKFRPRRDFEGMEKRRLQAARLFGEGKRQAEVALLCPRTFCPFPSEISPCWK